jgi:hypothetical protein
MKRIGIAALCLVAVFAMGAVMVSSASATIEIKTCIKAKAGKGTFKTDKCEGEAGAPGSGTYYLAPFSEIAKTKRKFTIKGPKSAYYNWLPTESGFPGKTESATECEVEEGTGEYTATGATFKIKYHGCKNGAAECKTEAPIPGGGTPAAGVVVDEQLAGTFVHVPGTYGYGISYTNEAKPETGAISKSNCGGLEHETVGGAIAEVEFVSTVASAEPAINLQPNANGGVQQQFLYTTEEGLSEAEQAEEAYAFVTGVPGAKTPQQLYTNISVSHSLLETIPERLGRKSELKGPVIRLVG